MEEPSPSTNSTNYVEGYSPLLLVNQASLAQPKTAFSDFVTAQLREILRLEKKLVKRIRGNMEYLSQSKTGYKGV